MIGRWRIVRARILSATVSEVLGWLAATAFVCLFAWFLVSAPRYPCGRTAGDQLCHPTPAVGGDTTP